MNEHKIPRNIIETAFFRSFVQTKKEGTFLPCPVKGIMGIGSSPHKGENTGQKTPHVEMLPSSEDVEYSTEAYIFQKININFYIPKFLFRKAFVILNRLYLSLTSQRSY